METYLNKGIKDVIKEFPEVGNVLNDYNIGCAPCNVGTCLLKDIVEVHNLSYEAESELMKRIAGVIYPGMDIAIPKIERKAGPVTGEVKYSPPLKRLVKEHILIKRLLSLIPQVVENLDTRREEDKQLIHGCVDFVRSYADKYHHAKEEDILFKKFSPDLEIINAMLEEHKIGRNHVKAAVEALEAGDNRVVKEHLIAYQGLLTDHIKKEDEILYPWMDRNLSMSQVGELFNEFDEADNKFPDAPGKYEGFVKTVEAKLKNEEVVQNA